MNPDETLETITALALRILTGSDADADPDPVDAVRLAGLVLDLDHWVRRGGCLPERWRFEMKAKSKTKRKRKTKGATP